VNLTGKKLPGEIGPVKLLGGADEAGHVSIVFDAGRGGAAGEMERIVPADEADPAAHAPRANRRTRAYHSNSRNSARNVLLTELTVLGRNLTPSSAHENLSLPSPAKQQQKMRIGILSLATSEIHAYAEYGFINKLAYAKRNCYDLHYYTEAQTSARPAAWSKILILERHLDDYDWVFWTDADSLIMNHSTRLESIISDYSPSDMMLTAGPNDRYNTGQWLIKSCDWSRNVLKDTWNNGPPSHEWFLNPWEQAAFIDVVNRNPEHENHISCVPMRCLNSRPSAEYLNICKDMEGIEYQDGDFIVHFYHAREFDSRVSGMGDYFSRWRRSDTSIDDKVDADRFDGGYKWTVRNGTAGHR
jgi:hypothetical protein